RLSGAPLRFAFDGYISHRPTLKMEGTLAADAASLRDTLRWAGQQHPPDGGFGRFALKAQTNVVGRTIALSGVNIELDGNSGEGVLSLDGQQSWQGTLAAEGLDLTPYVSTVRLLTGGERGWDSKPIALDIFDRVQLDLRLSACPALMRRSRLLTSNNCLSASGGVRSLASASSGPAKRLTKRSLSICASRKA